jgi:hypothetical protein
MDGTTSVNKTVKSMSAEWVVLDLCICIVFICSAASQKA